MKIKKYNKAYIALGANLSNPKQSFRSALSMMRENGVEIKSRSSLWHSPAWPAGMGYPDYVNAVVEIETSLAGAALLDFLHHIEADMGRIRGELNAPRPLDLDLLDYEGEISSLYPILPHPRLLERPFVLLPLLEVNPNWKHPIDRIIPIEALSYLPSKDVLEHYVIERVWT